MQDVFSTDRLTLDKLSTDDAVFISRLVNTAGWIRFIGNRNVNNHADAEAYIRRILENTAITYWVVRLRERDEPVGVVTFIKRVYLSHHDIGFAFLPEHNGKGYAFEAASTVMNSAVNDFSHSTILATTMKENIQSIALLKKLGLQFEKEILVENETLLVYSTNINADTANEEKGG